MNPSVVDLDTVKLYWNSVVSNLSTCYTFMNANNFYPITMLDEYEYIQIHEIMLTNELIKKYSLQGGINNEYLFAEVQKGIYRLP